MTDSGEKTVKYNLSLGFFFVIVLFVLFGVVSLREMQTVGSLTKMIYKHPLVVSNAALNAGLNMTKMHRSMKDVILSNSVHDLDKASSEVNEYEQLVYEQLDVIKEMIIGTEGQNLEVSPTKREISLIQKTGDIIHPSSLA